MSQRVRMGRGTKRGRLMGGVATDGTQHLTIFLDYEKRRRSADTEQTMHLRAGDDATRALHRYRING